MSSFVRSRVCNSGSLFQTHVIYFFAWDLAAVCTIGMSIIATISDKIVETLYLNRVISENKRIRTPPLSPPFKVGVFVVFYR